MADKNCCNSCCKLVVSCGFAVLFFWIFAQIPAKKPICSIEQFEVFALNNTSNPRKPSSNHTIYFNLKLKNRNVFKGVFYDDLNLNFSYAPNRTFSVASATFPGFHQGRGHSARRFQALEAAGVDWLAVEQAVQKNKSAVFRVDLVTAFKYRYMFWKSKRHHLEVSADLPVNGQGNLMRGKKGVKLTSGAGKGRVCYRALGLGLVSVLLHWSSFRSF